MKLVDFGWDWVIRGAYRSNFIQTLLLEIAELGFFFMDKKLLTPRIRFIQENLASNPVLILGSGHSASFGLPGMAELTDYLRTKLPGTLPPQEKDIWNKLNEAFDQSSLEDVLQKNTTTPILMDYIIRETWNCIFPSDIKVMQDILHDRVELPLTRLLIYLFRSTNKRLSIITTNYDRLIEYSIDRAGFAWATGFQSGYINQRYSTSDYYIVKNGLKVRMVDIWKVHGSLDWFQGSDELIYYLPSAVNLPEGFKPTIVTPGVEKYRQTHKEPFRSIITGADAALESGNSYICVGYGFNDEHIQPKLIERCKRQEKSIVVLSKKLTDSAKKVLLDGKCKYFLAFEETEEGTRMFTPDNLKGTEIAGVQLWSFGKLLELVI